MLVVILASVFHQRHGLHSHPDVAGWGAVDIRVGDDKKDLVQGSAFYDTLRFTGTRIGLDLSAVVANDTHSFRSSQCHSRDARNMLEAQFANSLSCLLLVSAVDCDGRPGGDVGFALASGFGFGVR